jgi:hypothetical protein
MTAGCTPGAKPKEFAGSASIWAVTLYLFKAYKNSAELFAVAKRERNPAFAGLSGWENFFTKENQLSFD